MGAKGGPGGSDGLRAGASVAVTDGFSTEAASATADVDWAGAEGAGALNAAGGGA